jgi:hypothetical protein
MVVRLILVEHVEDVKNGFIPDEAEWRVESECNVVGDSKSRYMGSHCLHFPYSEHHMRFVSNLASTTTQASIPSPSPHTSYEASASAFTITMSCLCL